MRMPWQYGEKMEWTGGKTEKGFANGKGKFTIYAADGSKRLEMDTECVAGKFHGPYLQMTYSNGRVDYEARGS